MASSKLSSEVDFLLVLCFNALTMIHYVIENKNEQTKIKQTESKATTGKLWADLIQPHPLLPDIVTLPVIGPTNTEPVDKEVSRALLFPIVLFLTLHEIRFGRNSYCLFFCYFSFPGEVSLTTIEIVDSRRQKVRRSDDEGSERVCSR